MMIVLALVDGLKSKKNILAIVPPAHGKSIILVTIAEILAFIHQDCFVYIVCHNELLQTYAFAKYGRLESSVSAPAQPKGDRRI